MIFKGVKMIKNDNIVNLNELNFQELVHSFVCLFIYLLIV